MALYELSLHGEIQTMNTLAYQRTRTCIPIFDGQTLYDRSTYVCRTKVCTCLRCTQRYTRGLRPLPIFSKNHKTFPKGMRVLLFDTETTGLPHPRNASVTDVNAWGHIVQWSWMVYDVDTHTIRKVRDTLIQLPKGMLIPEESTRIHGITTEDMRAHGNLFPKILAEFVADYETCGYLVAHNLEFDRKMIQVECFRHNLPVNFVWSRRKVIQYCTMKQSKSICGIKEYFRRGPDRGTMYIRYPKLHELHHTLFDKTQTTDLQNLHNSLVDILVCFRCFHVLVFEKDPFEYASVVQSILPELTIVYGKDYVDILTSLLGISHQK